MTRNERVRESCDKALSLISSNRKWLRVEVAPGHSCLSPFVTLDPRVAHDLEELIRKVLFELEPNRKGGRR